MVLFHVLAEVLEGLIEVALEVIVVFLGQFDLNEVVFKGVFADAHHCGCLFQGYFPIALEMDVSPLSHPLQDFLHCFLWFFRFAGEQIAILIDLFDPYEDELGLHMFSRQDNTLLEWIKSKTMLFLIRPEEQVNLVKDLAIENYTNG